MNREGKTYIHKGTGSLILVIKSKPMSAGTTRHTVLVIDSSAVNRKAGDQVDIDEVPVQPWKRGWDEV